MKLFLVGLPGSGKSTLGQQLAYRLKLPFVDLDNAIEQEAKQPIRDIFSNQGEEYFRQLEQRTLQSIINHLPSFVMATGGGAPCFSNSMEIMNQAGTTLFVDTPIPLIAERMQQEGIAVRPLLQALSAENFEQAYREKFAYRLPYYQQAAITVAPQDTIDELIIRLKS